LYKWFSGGSKGGTMIHLKFFRIFSEKWTYMGKSEIKFFLKNGQKQGE
jgi:hypothetical protein